MKILYIVSFFLSWSGTVLSVDHLSVLLNYSRNIRGFTSLTVLSCAESFNLRSWIFATNHSFFLQFVDMNSFWNVQKLSEDRNCHHLVVLELSCPGYQSAIKTLSRYDQFNNLCRAFLFVDSRKNNSSWFSDEFRPLLEQTELTYLSNVAYWSTWPVDSYPEGDQPAEKIYLYDLW